MITILAQVAIEELPQFIATFSTKGAQARRGHGSHGSQLFRVSEDETRVVILFEWESLEAWQGFLADAQVRETMKSSGTIGPPQFTVLEKVAEFPS